ncbi:hypothetical protein VTN96DRAFT_3613 [Rasamsonia emersonii]
MACPSPASSEHAVHRSPPPAPSTLCPPSILSQPSGHGAPLSRRSIPSCLVPDPPCDPNSRVVGVLSSIACPGLSAIALIWIADLPRELP